MSVDTYTKSGSKAVAPAKLDKKIFGVTEVNHQLLKDAYLSYLAMGRGNYARTKRRGEVRGGGQKPWRQKGTGRARFGSSRNPIWTGGGVAFGPTGSENYNRILNVKAKRQALKQALSIAATEDRIRIIEDIVAVDGKVKSVTSLLKKMRIEGSTVLVVEQKEANLQRATRNIPSVSLKNAHYLSVFDVLNADSLIITKKALEVIQELLGDKHA